MAFAQYQFRRDTAANWTSANPVLLAGELGYETDTQQFKVGNGTTAWNSLPYGGIQGPQGVQGPQGAAGTNGWSPILANVADGERRVLRLVDWTGGTGTKPAVPTDNYIGPTGFTNLAGATDIRGATGATGATGPAANAFTNIAVTGQNTVVADQANDTLTLVAGTNISLTTNDATDSVTISSTVAAQNTFANVSVGTSPTPTVLQADAAADTLTVNAGTGISLTADAATDTFTIANAGVTTFNGATGAITGVNSVNGQTGAVTVNAARPRIGPPVLANATTTTETVVARWTIPANFLVAGDSIRARVLHQSAGTGTLIYRLRIGAAGTITDGLVAQLTTSAAQAANAQGTADFVVYFPNTTTATGSGFAIQQAAALGTPTAAGANVTISNAAAVQLSITVTCSAAAANVTRGAHAVVGD